jgi:flavodoxin I
VEILVVFGSQYGNTQRIARAIARSLSSEHRVRVVPAAAASEIDGSDIDLLFVGAPTQMRGLRLLAKPFLDGLMERGFVGTRAAAFDTRMELGPQLLESTVISHHLADAGCRLVAKPESFLVLGLEGPLAGGEEERAERWARAVAGAAAAQQEDLVADGLER